MTPSETLILATYFFVLVILAVYGWHQYYLVPYMKNKEERRSRRDTGRAWPLVTIQLPIYNEMYVADRLIDAVCQIEYPRELLEDPGPRRLDRRDAQRGRAGRAAQRRPGMDITYIHRTDRTGYKAGALEAG